MNKPVVNKPPISDLVINKSAVKLPPSNTKPTSLTKAQRLEVMRRLLRERERERRP